MDGFDVFMFVLCFTILLWATTPSESVERKIYKDAILHGVGEYSIDPDGEKQFNWITNRVNPIE